MRVPPPWRYSIERNRLQLRPWQEELRGKAEAVLVGILQEKELRDLPNLPSVDVQVLVNWGNMAECMGTLVRNPDGVRFEIRLVPKHEGELDDELDLTMRHELAHWYICQFGNPARDGSHGLEWSVVATWLGCPRLHVARHWDFWGRQGEDLQVYQNMEDADAAVIVARQQGWPEAQPDRLLVGDNRWAVQLTADGSRYLRNDGEAR